MAQFLLQWVVRCFYDGAQISESNDPSMSSINFRRLSSMSTLSLAGAVLGGLSGASPVYAGLVTGVDAEGFRTGGFTLQMGAAQLKFQGSSYQNNPAYDYTTTVSAGSAVTELLWGAALGADNLVDDADSFAGGTETLQQRWQTGYMAYNPGYTSCGRYSCSSYPGHYYPVVTGSGLSGAWADSGQGFLGFRFEDNGWHYGWVELSVNGDQFDVGRWAYETKANVGVMTGSDKSLYVEPSGGGTVPEPDTLALLALGMLGLAAVRARRA